MRSLHISHRLKLDLEGIDKPDVPGKLFKLFIPGKRKAKILKISNRNKRFTLQVLIEKRDNSKPPEQ